MGDTPEGGIMARKVVIVIVVFEQWLHKVEKAGGTRGQNAVLGDNLWRALAWDTNVPGTSNFA